MNKLFVKPLHEFKVRLLGSNATLAGAAIRANHELFSFSDHKLFTIELDASKKYSFCVDGKLKQICLEQGGELSLCLSNPNEMLHMASTLASMPLLAYAIALDADRNSIIDRDCSNSIDSQLVSSSHCNEFELYGLTPLIKAVHSVSSTPSIECLRKSIHLR
jgi:hypothetical protein